MAQVIPNLGALSSAATGLGAGLQELAGRKIAEMQARDKQSNLRQKLVKAGYKEDLADLISSFPEKDLFEAVRSFPPGARPELAQNLQQNLSPEQNQIPSLAANLQALQQQQSGLKQQTAQETAGKSGLELLREAYGQGLPGAQAPSAPEKVGQINAQQLLEQARLQGITLTPEQEQKVMQRAAAINSNAGEMSKYQDALQGALKNYQSQQQPGAQAQPLTLQGAQQWFQKPLSETEKILQKTYELKKAKDDREAYKQVEPYLEEQRTDFVNASKEYEIAKDMLDIITKHKGKWPTASGYLPVAIQRDPDIREYDRRANELVIQQTNQLKGQATNFKTQLIQKGKIDLSQPVETQINALKKIIAKDKKVFDIQDDINKIGEINEGKFPRDLAQKIITRIGRPDIGQTQELVPGAKLSAIDTKKLVNGTPLNGPDGKKYVWDSTQQKPVPVGFGGK